MLFQEILRTLNNRVGDLYNAVFPLHVTIEQHTDCTGSA